MLTRFSRIIPKKVVKNGKSVHPYFVQYKFLVGNFVNIYTTFKTQKTCEIWCSHVSLELYQEKYQKTAKMLTTFLLRTYFLWTVMYVLGVFET